MSTGRVDAASDVGAVHNWPQIRRWTDGRGRPPRRRPSKICCSSSSFRLAERSSRSARTRW